MMMLLAIYICVCVYNCACVCVRVVVDILVLSILLLPYSIQTNCHAFFHLQHNSLKDAYSRRKKRVLR